MTIAGLDEVGDLFGRLCVNDAAEAWRAARFWTNHAAIVTDDADLYAAQSGMTRYHLFGIVCLKLFQVSAVQKTREDFAHVVRLAMIFRKDIVDVPRGACRFHAFSDGDGARGPDWKLSNKLPDLCHASLVRLNTVMRDA